MKETDRLEIVTDRMDDIRLASFEKNWGKQMLKFIVRDWKNRLVMTHEKLGKVFETLQYHIKRDAFDVISE